MYVKLQAEVGGWTTVGMFAKKANTGPKPAPIGYRIDWGERITFTRTDIRDVEDFAAHVPVRFRVQAELDDRGADDRRAAAALEVETEPSRRRSTAT